jgi:peroxiredoxin
MEVLLAMVSPSLPPADRCRRQQSITLTLVGAALIAAGVVGLLLPARGSTDTPSSPRAIGPAIGDLAPEVVATTMGGQKARLASLRGSPVVLTFWTTWCDACHDELPMLDDLARRRSDLRVVAVESDGSLAAVLRTVNNLHLRTLTVWRDPQAITLHDRYHSHAVPSTFVIDRHGVVENSLQGSATSEDSLELELLGTQSP